KESYYTLLQDIDYQFNDINLLYEALTHPSLSDELHQNYERLEFIGDAVLSLVISSLLFKKYKNDNEGVLSKKHADLVSGNTISKVAYSLKLGDYLFISKGEENCGGRDHAANLENTMEALIGAVYLDSNLAECFKIIEKLWGHIIEQMRNAPFNPKTALQEYLQERGLNLPKYQVIKKEGPDHAPIITVEAKITDNLVVNVKAHSKKSAETEAATILLDKLKNNLI
ncbi:MAG: ribonuclease III, partial [Pseudomonadota bacterium]